MIITTEQKNAIEYLEKYTKWGTYGERSLEKDITTVLNLVEELYKDNYRYEKELHKTIQYSISKEKIKNKIKELEEIKLCGGAVLEAITEEKILMLKELIEESEE